MKHSLLSFVFLTFALPICAAVGSLSQQIDSINAMRHVNSAASIQPLYNAFTEANRQHDKLQAARSLTYLAWALYDNNQPDLSLQLFEYAKMYCPDDDTELADLISLGVGAGYSALGVNNDGERILNESLHQSIKSGNKRETMMIYLFLGALYSNQTKDNKAKECFERARELAHSIGDTLYESAIYCNLGAYGETMAQSEALYNKSIALCQSADNKTSECHAYCNLAELYYNNNEYDKALRTLERANNYVQFLKPNDVAISQLHLLYSKIYSAQKDYTSAYNHSVRYSEQLNAEQHQQNIDRAKYRLLMKGIVRECETYNMNTQSASLGRNYYAISSLVLALFVFIFGYIYSQRKMLALKRENVRLATQNSALEDTLRKDDERFNNSKSLINYLYIFYINRNILLEKISDMIKEGYKLNLSQLIAHLKNTNNFISTCYYRVKDNEQIDAIAEECNQFVERLVARYPHLSDTDRQMAVYYRSGLSTREISVLTGKQTKTVTMARYRLKKELDIDDAVDLTDFLKQI
jgi:DNA-binding CsgD family transcriptional regulator